MIEFEKENIKLLQNGSTEAFEYLYYAYSPRLYGFVYNLTKSSDMAEEVVQESFIKIWENRASVQSDYSFKSYLFMIARNHVINVFRKQSLISHLEDYDAFEDNLAFSDNNAENFTELNDLKAYIEKAKTHLTPRQQQIFELSREKGLSNQEIADLLKITKQSVKNQLSTSLHTLQFYFDAKVWTLLPLICFYMNGKSDI